MKLRNIKNIKNLKGKVVLCRIDLNVELVRGKFDEFSDFKIRQALPIVKWLLRRGARVVLLAHLGRPKHKDSKYSLRPFVGYFKKHLGHRPGFLRDPKSAAKIIKTSKARIFLLENLRFWPGEEKNDPKFARELALLGSIYVNEAFADSHRAHASVAAITKFLPSFAGPLLEQEIFNLGKILKNPKKPFIALLGGAKISTKVDVIKGLSKKAAYILLGGALAHPFLVANGQSIGRSFIEKGIVATAQKILNKKIILPVDVVVRGAGGKGEVRPMQSVRKDDIIVDIGPATILRFAEFLRDAKTIVWNGPMGRFEEKPFAHGSLALGRLIAARARGHAFGLVGGGETLAVLARTGMKEYVDWVSTGGGAMLEFLAGKKLPGIKALAR